MSDAQLHVKLAAITEAQKAGVLSKEEANNARKRERENVTPGAPARQAYPQLVSAWDPMATQRGFTLYKISLVRLLPVLREICNILSLDEDKRDPLTGLFRKEAVRKFTEEQRDPRTEWQEGDFLPERTAVVYAMKWRPGPWLAPATKREMFTDANAVGRDPFAAAASRAKRLYQNGFKVLVLQPMYPLAPARSKNGYALKDQCVVDHAGMLVPYPGKADPDAREPQQRISYQEMFSWMPRLGKVVHLKDDTSKKVRFTLHLLGGEIRLGNGSWRNFQVKWVKPQPNDLALDRNGAPYKVLNEKGREVWARIPGSGARKTAEDLVINFTTGLGDRMVAYSVTYDCPDRKVVQDGDREIPLKVQVKRAEALANMPEERENKHTPFGYPTDADDITLGFSFLRDETTGEICPDPEYVKLSARERNSLTRRDMHDTALRTWKEDVHEGETLKTWERNEDGDLVEVPRKQRKAKPTLRTKKDGTVVKVKAPRSTWGKAKDSKKGGTWDRRHNAENSFHRTLDR